MPLTMELLDLVAQKRDNTCEIFSSIVNFIRLFIGDPDQVTNSRADVSQAFTRNDEICQRLFQAFEKWLNNTSRIITVMDSHWTLNDKDELKVQILALVINICNKLKT